MKENDGLKPMEIAYTEYRISQYHAPCLSLSKASPWINSGIIAYGLLAQKDWRCTNGSRGGPKEKVYSALEL